MSDRVVDGNQCVCVDAVTGRIGGDLDGVEDRDARVDQGAERTSELGDGGFGLVILCEHKKTGRAMAMKVIKPEDKSDIDDTITEMALQQMSKHQNIIRTYRTYFYNEKYYIAMEWMDAGDLSDMLKDRGGKVPEAAISYMAEQVLQALKFLHTHNRMHRDLKPLNVMLNTQGEIKLGDFGLAAQLTVDSFKKKAIKGTPKWMAPEIFTSGREPYNALCDIWSLGIIMLELADGRNPFKGLNIHRIMHSLISFPPPGLSCGVGIFRISLVGAW